MTATLTGRMTVSGRRSGPGHPPILEEGWDDRAGNWPAPTSERDPGSKGYRILTAIAAGAHFTAACEYARVNRTTAYKWVQRARFWLEENKVELGDVERDKVSREDRPYVDFLRELNAAEARGEVELVILWRSAARDDWRAARDLLARRHPERWREQSTTELVGAGGGPIQTIELTQAEVARQFVDNPQARRLASQLLAQIAPVAPPAMAALERPDDELSEHAPDVD